MGIFLAQTLSLFVSAFVFLMLARIFLNILLPDGDGPLVGFVYTVTEVAVCPIRVFCDRMDWFQSVPVDMPFLLTYLLFGALRLLMELTA